MSWPRVLRACLLVCLVAGTSACEASRKPSGPRLVVLYATCTLNKNFLSPYNPDISFTPNFSALAAESLVFTRHQTESGQSGTSFASIFTGTQAMDHGILRHPTPLGDDAYLIGEAYAEAGYEPHGFLSHPMASARLNYAQGIAPENAHKEHPIAQKPALARILDRLEAEPDYRAFVVTSFTVTHGPYRGALLGEFCARYPAECELLSSPDGRERFRRLRRLYRGSHLRLSYDFEITAKQLGLDEQDIGDLEAVVELLYKADVFELDLLLGNLQDALRERGLLDETLLAVTSDHGEVLVRRDSPFRWTHGFQLAPEVLGVALMIRGPSVGVRPGRYDAVTRSIDVFPTLAGLTGIQLPENPRRGTDLSAAARGESRPPELLAFSHTSLLKDEVWQTYQHFQSLTNLFPSGDDPDRIWTAVRSGDEFHVNRHLDGAWRHSVADLATGPTRDALDFTAPRADQGPVRLELESYRTELSERFKSLSGSQTEIDSDQTSELLRSIGYIE